MLVKVRPNLFINTNQVESLEYESDNNTDPLIHMSNNASFPVTEEAAIYLMQQMDVAQAVILPGEAGYIDPNAPTAQPLTSRIAVLLRDEFPQGASADQLMDTLHLDYYLTVDALMSLCAERVAQFHETEHRYYHASHYPKIYAPEREIDLLDIAPFQSAVRDGELQCVECKHQSCATCVLAKKCCQCSFPSFTLITPNPDPSAEGAGLASSPAEDTEKTAVLTIANLCDLCGFPLTSRTHLDNCVLLGVLE